MKTVKSKVDGHMDSYQSWVMAVCSVLVFFVCMGFTRADGVMFVALMQDVWISRETASWPFNLAGVSVVFMAPVTGILSTRFPYWSIGICGSLLFALGYCACYLFTNIVYLSVCLGLIKGSGQAMVITIIPALITNSFKRYRATAMGIATTGTPLGGLVLPLLVQYLLQEYGIRGTFLILGGIALHAVVGTISYMLYPKSTRPTSEENCNPPITSSSCNTKHDHGRSYNSSQRDIPNVHFVSSEAESSKFGDPSKTRIQFVNQYPHKCDNAKSPETCYESTALPVLRRDITKQHSATLSQSSYKYSLSLLKNVFTTRGFYLVVINQIISLQLIEMFSLVVVDYSVDKGISYASAILLITITSGCEIFGRLSFGWVTDKQFLRRPTYMMVCQTISATIVLLFSFTSEYYILAVIAGLLGMVQGSTRSVTHVVFSDYLRKEEIALGIAFGRSFNGLASVARSPIIGYFRDDLGSYDLLFLSASLVFFAAGLMWFSETIYLYISRKKSNL